MIYYYPEDKDGNIIELSLSESQIYDKNKMDSSSKIKNIIYQIPVNNNNNFITMPNGLIIANGIIECNVTSEYIGKGARIGHIINFESMGIIFSNPPIFIASINDSYEKPWFDLSAKIIEQGSSYWAKIFCMVESRVKDHPIKVHWFAIGY